MVTRDLVAKVGGGDSGRVGDGEQDRGFSTNDDMALTRDQTNLCG